MLRTRVLMGTDIPTGGHVGRFPGDTSVARDLS
jgi:hypothetical protein